MRTGSAAFVALAAAGMSLALAGPAAADSGGSHDVPLVAQAPTIDGSIGTIEWSGATSFPVPFNGLTATAHVERTATNLYFALSVNDTAAGDSDVFFDNNDDGALEPGDDLMAITGGAPSDWYAIDASFTTQLDTSGGGTNDVAGAETFANGVVSFEYEKPLCSADSAHDFCFQPPPTETSPPSKLGFTVGYRNTAGQSFLAPAQIGDPANYGELVIQPPDTTPPTVSLTAPPTDSVQHGTITLGADATDSGTGVADVRWQVASSQSGPWQTVTHATAPTSGSSYSIQWDSHAIADGGWYMRAEAVDGAGNPADSDPIFFTVANDGPTISFGCFVGDGAPGSCTHWFTVSPVSLNIDTTDPQGVSSVKYTLDGSDPATNGTPFKTTLSLAQTTLVRVVATDTLGNVSTASLELQIDTTAPAAPSFTYENVSGNVVGNGSTVWFQPGGSGSVQVDVLGNDAESGIASATIPPADGLPAEWSAAAGTTASSAVYSVSKAGSTAFELPGFTVTNGAGLTSPASTLEFAPDSTPPDAVASCDGAPCDTTRYELLQPLQVSLAAVDAQSGPRGVMYTTDGSDPATSTTAHAFTDPIQVSQDTTIDYRAIDGVGNVGALQTLNLSVSIVANPTWTLGKDILTGAAAENPNPDQYGDAGVWQFGEEPLAGGPFTLYTHHFAGTSIDGLPIFCWNSTNPAPDGYAPTVCGVTNGSQISEVHPAPDRFTVARWVSPVAATVAATGGFTDVDANCGDGVNWRVTLNGNVLDQGAFGNGGSVAFGPSLSSIAVHPGDVLEFAVGPGPNDDFYCDSTRADVTISEAQAAAAPPADVYVNAAWAGTAAGADPDGSGPATSFGTDAFATIHDALAVAAANATIHVAAGTYAEASPDAQTQGLRIVGDGAATTHVDLTGTFGIDANDVHVSGLDFQGSGVWDSSTNSLGGGQSAVVRIGNGATAVVFSGNSVSGGLRGVQIQQTEGQPITGNEVSDNELFHDGVAVDLDGAQSAQILDNDIHDNGNGSAQSPQAAVLIEDTAGAKPAGDVVSGNTIANTVNHGISVRTSGNTIANNSIAGSGDAYPRFPESSGIELTTPGIAPVDDNVISGNTITGSAFAGIKLGSSSEVSGNQIEGNTITGTLHGGASSPSNPGAGGSAILVASLGASSTAITSNTLTGNGGAGIFQSATTTEGTSRSAGNVASQNTISGNGAGVVDKDPAVFDARNNWWGSADGPSGAGPGHGDSVSTNVLFDPFLTSAPGSDQTQQGPTFTVTTADDHLDETGCTILDCTLREAITAANGAGVPTTIDFAIGRGPQTIVLSSALPSVTGQTTIDGTSQPGFVAQPIVAVDGSALDGGDGLDLFGTGDVVRGLALVGFADTGIGVFGGGGATIAGNFVGVGLDGVTASPATRGIELSSDGSTVGGAGALDRNVIAAGQIGVAVSESSDNVVEGNYIGTDASGAAIGGGNAQTVGVELASADGTTIRGNVVSGGLEGIHLSSSNENTIEANQIGADLAGTTSPGFVGGGSFAGVSIAVAARQLADGSWAGTYHMGSHDGPVLQVQPPSGDVPYWCVTGLQPDSGGHSILFVKDVGDGVSSFDQAELVSSLADHDCTNFQPPQFFTLNSGNFTAGPVPVGNTGDGVSLRSSSSNTIDAANVIDDNLGAGVDVVDASSTGNAIQGNSIDGNGHLGIDLGGDYVTSNGITLTAAHATEGPAQVAGTLAAAPSTQYRLDFYASSACDPSGYGQGARWLGDASFTTDGNGNAAFDTGSQLTGAVATGESVTATATDPSGTTSEFSTCVLVSGDVTQTGPVFTVNTAADHDDGACTVRDCTLREAIVAANAHANGDGPDRIVFAIGDGSAVIRLASSELPPVTDPVTIDASTQPGWLGPPLIELDGSGLTGNSENGFLLEAPNTTVRGFSIVGFSEFGIIVNSDHATITDDYVGLKLDGVTRDANLGGVRVNGSSSTVGGLLPTDRNVLSGNFGGSGVWISGNHPELGGGVDNTVIGNYLGTTADGTASAGSRDGFALGFVGARIDAGATGNVVGGSSPADANVMSGNNFGVRIEDAGGNTVQGNFIGTDPTGTKAVANAVAGVRIEGPGANTIAGNVISGNTAPGVDVQLAGAGGNTIHDNLIGTDATGFKPLGNAGDGVRVEGGAGRNVIDPNTIAYNGGNGVTILASTGNQILGNSIHDNTGLGIDLGGDGITPNDPGDTDTGANELQNFPVLQTALTAGDGLAVTGTLDSLPSASYRIELFASPACRDSGDRPAQTFLGALTVRTDVTGHAVVDGTVRSAAGVVTATATDSDGNTSEISDCLAIGAGGQATAPPTVNVSTNVTTALPGAAAVPIAAIPASAFTVPTGQPSATPLDAVPLDAVPLDAVPLDAVPLDAVPLDAVPLGKLPLDAVGFSAAALAKNGLGGIPLTTIPLVPPRSWDAILAGTTLANVPLQNVTLGQVLSLANPPAELTGAGGVTPISLKDIDLSSSPLDAVPLDAVALGSTPLDAVPINGTTPGPSALAAWCALLGTVPNFTCDANATLIGAALAGAPLDAVPLDAVPLDAVDLSQSPLDAVPLDAVDLTSSPLDAVPLDAVDYSGTTALGSVKLADLSDPNGVADCSLVDCATATIKDAFQAHALKPGATIGDLAPWPGLNLGNIGEGLPANITLRDLLALLMGTSPRSWESLPLAGLQYFASLGGQVAYDAAFSIQGGGGLGTATITAALPAGAVYVRGSTALTDTTTGATAPLAEPTLANGTLTWHVATLTFGDQYDLKFELDTGLALGRERATVTVATAGVSSTSANADVTIHDSFENNDSAANAQPIAKNTLYLSYLTSGSDKDFYTLTVPKAGTQVKLFLSHLHADYDLAVLGPGQQPLRSAPLDAVPLDAVAQPDDPTTLQQATQALAPTAIQDIPLGPIPAGDTVLGVSDNRGLADEEVDVTTTQANSTLVVAVLSYQDATSDQPYVLRAQVVDPPALPPCPSRQFASSATPTVQLPTVSSATQTLILVNEKRLQDTYGLSSTDFQALLAKLNAYATRSDVNGVVVPVEADPNVAAAYAAWDGPDPNNPLQSNSCSPSAANDVVRAINGLIDNLRKSAPSLKNLVVVGGDDEIPMARLLDAGSYANERQFYSSFGFTTNNEYIGAVANGYLLSDDPYADPDPQPFLGGSLYVPKLALGRLVETPADISKQLDQYTSLNGTLSPKTEVSTGYDFLSDGTQATEAALNSAGMVSTLPSGQTLIRDDWTHTDLTNALFPAANAPQVDVVNAHYDQHRALPAIGNQTGTQSDLFKTVEVARHGAGATAGRLIFTIGCHSGFAIFDGFYPSYDLSDPSVTDVFQLDWPQAYVEGGAAGFVGNTGYGLGDTTAVAYSEKLQALFAQRLDGTLTAGQALEFAKEDYVGQLGVIGPYDAKAVNESTFYGLPTWKLGGGSPAIPPANAPTTTDADTGLQSLGFDVSPTLTAVPKTTGTYFTTASPASVTGYQATNRRPIEPLTTVDVTEPNLVAHGAVLTGLTSDDTSPFTAAFSRVVDDNSTSEPTLGGQVDFPSKLQAVASVATPNGDRQRLVLIAGQFRSDGNGANTGTQRLFRRLAGKVLYSTSTDFTPPSILNVQVLSVSSGNVAFAADVTDNASGVAQVLVLYHDTGNVWKSAALGCTNGHCTGGGPFSGTGAVDYFLQAVDGAGNVGVSSGKAFAQPVTLPQSSGTITITPSAQPNASGWYVDPASPITLTATGPTGVALTFSVDGAAFQPVSGPFPTGGITANGIHTVEVRGADGSRAFTVIAIDSSAPVIKITRPSDGADFLAGDAFKSDFTCSDSGSGLAANGCTGPAFVDTTLPSGSTGTTKTFTVTAKDIAGHTTTKTVTYNVWQWTGFLSPVNNPPTVNVAKAGSAIPVKFTLGGNRGLSIFHPGYPISQKVACDSDAPLDTIESTVSAGSSSLQFDSTSNQYTYVWKTDGSWAGTCRDLTVKFVNGSSRTARFKFK